MVYKIRSLLDVGFSIDGIQPFVACVDRLACAIDTEVGR